MTTKLRESDSDHQSVTTAGLAPLDAAMGNQTLASRGVQCAAHRSRELRSPWPCAPGNGRPESRVEDFDNPVLVNVTDPETHVEYVLHVQINHWGGIGIVRIESARLWIGQAGFDVELVQDDHRVTERAGDFIRRKLMPQIIARVAEGKQLEQIFSELEQ